MTSKLAAATNEICSEISWFIYQILQWIICRQREHWLQWYLLSFIIYRLKKFQLLTTRWTLATFLSFIVYKTNLRALRHGTAAVIFGNKVHLASTSPFNLSLLLSVDRAPKNHNRIYSICEHLNNVCPSSVRSIGLCLHVLVLLCGAGQVHIHPN